MPHAAKIIPECAFVLGAGLGTRLRPLTADLPKPLVPFFQRPLIRFVLEHLRAHGIGRFVINTHHAAQAYPIEFPDSKHQGCPVAFCHEPVLLDTGGGLRNAAPLLGPPPWIIYNGDQLCDMSLAPLLETFQSGQWDAVLLLRPEGPNCNVQWDPATGHVLDLRGELGVAHGRSCQFTGIYMTNPRILELLPKEGPASIIPAFLQLARNGRLGGVVESVGEWRDLGTLSELLDAHRELENGSFPTYGGLAAEWMRCISSSAVIGKDCRVEQGSCIGREAVIEAGAHLHNSLVWPGARVRQGANLERCVVRGQSEAVGKHHHEIL